MSKFRLIPYAVLTAGGLIAASEAANAQSMYDINQRQDYQQNRIERGINDGQLTRSEAGRLEQGERRIDFAQARAKADGRVTGQERARIERMTDRQGREIYQQSHDRQQAWDGGQGWGRTDGRPHNGWNDLEGRGRGTGTGAGTGSGTATGSGRTWGGGNGSWHHGGTGAGTGTTTPTTVGTAVASNTGNRNWGNWGGQTRPVSATPGTSAPTRNYATANTGAHSGGGRNFGGGGHR